MTKWMMMLTLMMLGSICFAQKALLLERVGTLKTRKFFIGETLVYKLNQDSKHWLEEVIVDLDPDGGYIFLEHRVLTIDQIYAIQIRDAGNFARGLSALLTTFGYSWGFWSLVSVAFGDNLTPTGIAIGLGSFIVGQLLRTTFFKTYKLNDRKRLKLIDLTFYELVPSRS